MCLKCCSLKSPNAAHAAWPWCWRPLDAGNRWIICVACVARAATVCQPARCPGQPKSSIWMSKALAWALPICTSCPCHRFCFGISTILSCSKAWAMEWPWWLTRLRGGSICALLTWKRPIPASPCALRGPRHLPPMAAGPAPCARFCVQRAPSSPPLASLLW